MELCISSLQKICSLQNIEITLHAARRLEQRGISVEDIISSIHSGKIIEQYPTDYPYPSCLILVLSLSKAYLHVVVGTDQKTLWIITAYYPDKDKWDATFQIRKE